MTRLYSPAINHDTRSVEPAHGNDSTWHIFVTAGDGNVSVVPLRSHNGFNAIGNEVSGLQAVAHTSGAHGYCVADADGVEAEGNHASGGHAFADGFGEKEEMHITSVSLVPDRGDSHLGLRHVLLGESYAVEHGLRRSLRLRLRDSGTVLVQLDRFGGGVHRDGGSNGERT
ncbi:hypothetical protein V8G54_032134 [Vigna mungo]|uniref:Uncharacterized protein n=1 Tax=Vigna mungo TaxID=3915 RepID=A0AAQ3MKR7_VIGMU